MSVIPHPSRSKKEPGLHWYIDVGRGKDRKRIPFRGNYEEAVALEKALRQSADIPVPTVAKISELIVPFLEFYRGKAAESTVKDAVWVIQGHLIHFFGPLQPRQITPTTIDQYKELCLGKELSRRTINKHLSILSTLIKFAVKRKHCQPLDFIIETYTQGDTEAAERHPLTKRQVDAIYRALDPQYRLTYLLMVDMGLRRNEAMKIRVEDINATAETVSVLGKGNKVRVIPWTTTRLSREIRKALKNRHSGPLVVNPQTGKAYYSIRKALIRAAKKAGVDDIHHHLLRHSFLSLAAEKDISPYALQKIAGHSDLKTTMRIYTKVGNDFVSEEVKKLRKKRVTKSDNS